MDTCVLKKLNYSQDRNIISFQNHKGGVLKSTLTDVIGHLLMKEGKKVLIIDNDPQQNLTQKQLIRSAYSLENRLDKFYMNLSEKNYMDNLEKYPIYVYNKNYSSGKLGVLAGSSKIDIGLEYSLRSLGNDVLQQRFQNALDFYSQYFDYILIDTAPSINNNINNLTLSVTDNIIIPFDSPEALLGLDQFVEWVYRYRPNNRPNALFVLTKYQRDTLDILLKYQHRPDIYKSNSPESQNINYRILKTLVPDFVCDNGIPERQILKNHDFIGLKGSYDVARKYKSLMKEIFEKLAKNQNNLFDYWRNEHIESKLEELLKPLEQARHNNRSCELSKFEFKN
jgi:cellulose biosynthesis protein BcsQ